MFCEEGNRWEHSYTPYALADVKPFLCFGRTSFFSTTFCAVSLNPRLPNSIKAQDRLSLFHWNRKPDPQSCLSLKWALQLVQWLPTLEPPCLLQLTNAINHSPITPAPTKSVFLLRNNFTLNYSLLHVRNSLGVFLLSTAMFVCFFQHIEFCSLLPNSFYWPSFRGWSSQAAKMSFHCVGELTGTLTTEMKSLW